jgi:CRP-like cAMP-binding protein
MTLEQFESETKLLAEGSECFQISVVMSGDLELYLGEGPQSVVLDNIKAGGVIGMYSVLSYENYKFNARANGNTQILALSA